MGDAYEDVDAAVTPVGAGRSVEVTSRVLVESWKDVEVSPFETIVTGIVNVAALVEVVTTGVVGALSAAFCPTGRVLHVVEVSILTIWLYRGRGRT